MNNEKQKLYTNLNSLIDSNSYCFVGISTQAHGFICEGKIYTENLFLQGSVLENMTPDEGEGMYIYIELGDGTFTAEYPESNIVKITLNTGVTYKFDFQ